MNQFDMTQGVANPLYAHGKTSSKPSCLLEENNLVDKNLTWFANRDS